MTERKGAVLIFSPRLEQVYLTLLALFLCLAAFDILTGSIAKMGETLWIEFLVTTLFFNGVHIFFTISGLVALPEGRNWIKSQFKSVHAFAMVFILLAILYQSFAHQFGARLFQIGYGIVIALAFLKVIHNIGQTRGLAMICNRGLERGITFGEKAKFQSAAFVERILFQILTAVLVSAGMIRIFESQIEWISRGQLIPWLAGLAALLIAALAFNSRRFPGVYRSNKTFMSCGLLIYAASILNPFALMLQRALHGVEYVFLSQRILQNSKVKWNRTWVIVVVGVIFFGVVLNCGFKFFPAGQIVENRNLQAAIVGLLFFTEYSHYYLDSKLFRLSDASTRAIMEPLLMPKES